MQSNNKQKSDGKTKNEEKKEAEGAAVAIILLSTVLRLL
jgi:hypothetical protein